MFKKINLSSKEQNLIVYIVLTIVTLAVYGQVNQFEFVNVDDNIYVTENIHIQSGITLAKIRWAFTTIYSELWNPLTLLSYMLDYQLYGLNARGYHVTNLILHIFSTLLLFQLLRRMTGTIWESTFVAAFFALHPMHVESVAWISERRDVLSAFFWMLTLYLYTHYTEKPVIRRYLLVVFSFVLALMSKSMVVTLPVIMILLDYWPLKRFESQKGNLILWQFKEKFPLFVLSAAFSIMTLYAHRNRPIEHFPLWSCLANASVSFVTYLGKTFWPYDMNVFYPFPDRIPIWQISMTSMLIILVSLVTILTVKRLPYLFVGWFWYIIAILPVMGIIQDTDQAMADRYHYLPSIGISIMLAWGIPFLIKNNEARRKILFPTGIIFIIIMAVLTWKQCGYWKNSIELCKHTLQVTKNNYVACNCLARATATEGKIKEAIYYYSESIKLKPTFTNAINSRGIIYGDLGEYQRAIKDFNEAIRINPYYAEAYNNRGFTYHKIGQYKLAIEDYNKAIICKPDLSNAYSNRAFYYLKYGDKNLGCNDAQKACKLGNCKTLESAQGIGLCR